MVTGMVDLDRKAIAQLVLTMPDHPCCTCGQPTGTVGYQDTWSHRVRCEACWREEHSPGSLEDPAPGAAESSEQDEAVQPPRAPVRSCRVCGCTDQQGREWAGDDLCDSCPDCEDLGDVVVRPGATFRLYRRGDRYLGSTDVEVFGDWAHEDSEADLDAGNAHDYWPTIGEIEHLASARIADGRLSYLDYDIHPVSRRLLLHFDLVPLVRIPPMPLEEAIVLELRRALHRIKGAEGRWQWLRLKAASDAELLEAIGTEWGAGGGASGDCKRNSPGYQVQGGKAPRFWLGLSTSRAGKATLHGKALVAQVRGLLAIPAPPPPYAWVVTYSRNNGQPECTVTLVAKTEHQARRKALLSFDASEVVSLHSLTEKQYRRAHDSQRKRL